jgi:hypothetical protein
MVAWIGPGNTFLLEWKTPELVGLILSLEGMMHLGISERIPNVKLVQLVTQTSAYV